MLAQLWTPWAFLVRDCRIDLSYKVRLATRLAGALLNIAVYYFITQVFGDVAAPHLARYGGSYFAFIIIGIAFTDYMTMGIGAISSSIREGQTTGTLELMLLSPTRLMVVLLSSSIWSYIIATLRVAIYFGLGMLLGMQLDNVNLPFALLSLGVAIVSFEALGLFAASLVILFKSGDPAGWMIRVSSMLLSGVFYPVGVLPEWLRLAAQALPLTHALELLRRSLLRGEGIAQLWGELLALTLLTAVLLPLGMLACSLAIRVARTDGSLSYY